MADDRKINIGLSFTADTSKAREEMNKLKNDLSKIISTAGIGQVNSNQFNGIINQAAQLRGVLEESTKATGKLDLSKFERGIKAANIDLNAMAREFKNIDGGKFFNDLTQQVMAADTRVNILSGSLKKFAQGLMNTAMWTIQSNAIHAVESALSNAYGYAQKLNKGLTDIAIVSDLNTQQLTEFARTANQMAKELSASTADYVSGALIYYQAGLSDEEVIERTNTTIKLAQTSGETAESISSYMTAIWNNFYDGSKSVEYYADAISYLGAVTAASNADIAEGMQSFAAVADTVGLSFEYGASALTLLRDITQQSASTIGNSLKTIFARLSSVAQGDTLEDGVDYTKYSKALSQVGVEVVDVNGDLRDMDDILDDLGARWNSLNDAQKVALAQTVGGVRQYNNLISLMDNYEQFQELASEASQSDGYLQKQADIYAESWEAARNRLEAAWQGIYDQLIDDKFFIKLTNFLTGIVNFISQIIDGAGGLKGVISMVVMGISSLDPDHFSQKLREIKDTLLLIKDALTGVQEKANIDLKSSFLDIMFTENDLTNNTKLMSLLDDQEKLLTRINKAKADGQEQEAMMLQALFDRRGQEIQQLIEEDNELNKIKNTIEELSAITNTPDAAIADMNKNSRQTARWGMFANDLRQVQKIGKLQGHDVGEEVVKLMGTGRYDDVTTGHILEEIIGDPKLIDEKIKEAEQNVTNGIKNLITKARSAFKDVEDPSNVNAIKDVLGMNDYELTSAENGIQTLEAGISNLKEAKAQAAAAGLDENSEALQALSQEEAFYNKIIDLLIRQGELTEKQKAKLKELKQEINPDQVDWATMTTSAIRAASSISAMSSGMNGLFDSIKNGNISFGSLIGSLGSIWTGTKTATTALKGLSAGLEVAAKGSGIFAGIASKLVGILGGIGTGGLLAIVGGLVVAFRLFKKAQEDAYKASAQGQLDAANEALKEQEQLVNKLTSKYNDTISTIDKLKNVETTFKDLKENTAAWTEAVQANNEAAIDLLETYDLLKRANYDIDDKGRIIIKGEILDQISSIAQSQLTNARLGKYAAQNQVSAARGEMAIDQAVKAMTNTVISKGDGDNLATGGIGVRDIINAMRDGLLDIGTELGGDFADKLENTTWADLITTNKDVRDALYNATTELQKSTEAQQARNQQIGTSLAASEASVPEFAKDYFAKIFGEKYQEAYNTQKTTLDDLTDAQIGKQYGDSEALKNAGLSYNSKDNAFYNAEGEQVGVEKVRQLLATELARVEVVNPEDIANALATDENGNYTNDEVATAKAEWDANEQTRNIQEAEGKRNTTANEDIATLGFKADEIADVAKEINYLVKAEENLDKNKKKFSDATKDNEGALKKLSTAATQTQEGFDELEKGYQDWYKALKGSDPLAKAKAMDSLKDSLADIMDISDELANSEYGLGEYFGEYITDHQDVVLNALKGDRDAIIDLQEAAAQDLVIQLANDGKLEVDLETAQALVSDHMDLMRQMLDDGSLKLGAVDNADLLASMTETINSLTTDVKTAEHILARMGYDAKVEEAEVPGDPESYWVPPVYENNVTDGSPRVQTRLVRGGRWETVEGIPTKAHALKIVTADYIGGGNVLGAKGGTSAGKQRVKNATTPSGSGGSSKKQKTKEPDRYHEINAKIQQNQAEITKLTDLESRLYGQEKLDAMEREAELLEEQAKLYEQKYQEALRYYEMDKKNLQNNYGATFNPDGTIANYDEWYAKYLAKYNSGKMDDDAWSKFEDAIKKYEESLNLLDETEKAKLDATNKAFDKGLESIEYRLKTINELIDKDIDYLDYMIKQLDKSMYDTADVIALIGKKTEDVYQKTLNEQKAIEDILKHHGGLSDEDIAKFMSGQEDISDIIAKVKDLTETEVKNLMEHQSALIKYNETLIELREEAYEKLGESIDEFNDKIERQKDIISDLDGVMNHYRNIIDIVGKDTLGISDEMLRQMSELSVTAAKGALEISRDELTKNQTMLEALYKRREELLAAGREADARLLDKEIEAQEDRVRQLSEAWASAWEDALHAAEEAFKNSVTLATDAFSQAMAGTIGSLDDLQEAMDMQNTLNDRYLPTYQKIYELNKLTRDVNNAIDNTNNIAGKERLLKLQQDIVKKQEDGAELTEYELGMFQRRLELEQARIAMEEAQNAKNMVRMTRDSEGNWSYTYTADSEAAAQAEQNYEDKLYDLKKYNQDSMKEFEDAMWQAVNEYKNSIADLDLTDEERAKRIKDFQEQWVEHNKDMFQMTLEDAQWILDTYGGVDDLVNTFMETISGKTTQYSDLTDFFAKFNESSQTMMDEVGTSYRTWDEQYKDIFEKAGTSADDFKDKVTEDMKAIEESIVGEDGEGGAVGAAKELGDQMTEQFDGIMENLRKWFEGEDGGYSKMIDSIVSQNEKLYGSIQALLSAYAKLGQVSNFAGDNKDIKVGEVDTGTGQGEIPGFASGGYTGSWGNTGKLAVLHEKELILNQSDTENLLTAVNFVRDLTRMISLNAAEAGNGLGNLFSAGVGQGGGFLDQTVTIHAEFPNATNHSEIEEAFSNLIGLASQYAGRRK